MVEEEWKNSSPLEKSHYSLLFLFFFLSKCVYMIDIRTSYLIVVSIKEKLLLI
ncbi:hypothetical protein LguiB_022968 [Lonicera macranthoides]